MQTVCTIITADYLPLAKALHRSLQKNLPGTSLQVLVVNENNFSSADSFFIHSLDVLSGSSYFKEIEKKYAHTNADYFRWALKPLFIGHLLEKGFSKVIFADPDLYFISNFSFLFDELERNNVLLTPHWRSTDPVKNEDSLLAVLKDGLYNAGFIAVNKNATDVITWWAGVCHYKTEALKDIGLFVDQKYLDIVPVQFDNVHILKHKGCNLAAWNIDTCKRELINGKLFINKIFEPVFIHFTKDTIINILNRNDILLQPFLNDYISALQKEGFSLLENLDNLDPQKYKSSAYKLKHQLRLRTRVKRFFFKLAEKL